MSRNDLPNERMQHFGMRTRETLQTMLGLRGDKLDRVVTVRDLTESGMFTIPRGYNITPGALPLEPGDKLPKPEAYVPDLTPPPTPDGFAVSAAISHILIEHAAPAYLQGHGHLRTRVYGAVVLLGDPLPVFDDAQEVAQFSGTVYAFPSNPATTWRLWIKWETADGVLSPSPAGGVNGLAVTTGQDVSKMVLAMTGEGNPFTILAEPTTIAGFTYPAGTYSVRSFIIDAQITNAKIANLAVDDAKIANVSVDKLTAGSIEVGQFIQSTGYVAGSAGWHINGEGTAEFSGVVVRGTVFATDGTFAGTIFGGTASGYSTGIGFYAGFDVGAYKWRVGDPDGNRIQWNGTTLLYRGSLDVKSAASGARMEIKDNVIKVFDAAGVLRVQIGDLSA